MRADTRFAAMIPQHPSASLPSERAAIDAPRVRALADALLRARREEIAEIRAPIAEGVGR